MQSSRPRRGKLMVRSERYGSARGRGWIESTAAAAAGPAANPSCSATLYGECNLADPGGGSSWSDRSDTVLLAVVGGLNPQPLPPRVRPPTRVVLPPYTENAI